MKRTRPFTLVTWALVAMLPATAAILLAQETNSKTPPSNKDNSNMNLARTPFGKTDDGSSVEMFTLTNSAGNLVQLTNYGAILVSVQVPDRDGKRANVNLGFDNLKGYLDGHPYFGASVGRYANRIAKGKFSLDGRDYTLAVNNGPNHLHGGLVGFDKQVWQAEELRNRDSVGVRFTLHSPDGQEGYPGNLDITAEYTWNNDNELAYTLEAKTDAATVLNLTNHAYWNLAGAGSGDVLEHVLQLKCDKYVAVDDTLIPTGDISKVDGSPLDFREPHALGERIAELPDTKGYDHCYVVDGAAGELRSCAVMRDPSSGRVMEISTTQPGVQLYTANHLGAPWGQHGAFCLETQHYPDSPNHPDFPTTRLNPGETFSETTVIRFKVE
ncbi:MAG: aldose epimerase family protein [Aureliella sp.]